MSLTCPARGCGQVVSDHVLMCPAHWRLVPGVLKAAVRKAYNRGEGLGTDELVHAQDAAIRAVNGR